MKNFIVNLINYKELLNTSVRKEIRGKYKGAWLGVIWSFLNPLFMSIILALVFGSSNKFNSSIPVNFKAMVLIGNTAWIFFATGISQGTFSIIANGGIIKKVYFPREVIPVAFGISNLVVFLITSLVSAIFAIWYGGLSFYWLIFPLIAIIQTVLVVGITMITSAVNVYFRDLEHIITVTLSALYYLTPIFILHNIPSYPWPLQVVLYANPMKYIVESYQDVLLNHQLPNFYGLLYVLVLGVVLLYVGVFVFNKLQKGFAEEF